MAMKPLGLNPRITLTREPLTPPWELELIIKLPNNKSWQTKATSQLCAGRAKVCANYLKFDFFEIRQREDRKGERNMKTESLKDLMLYPRQIVSQIMAVMCMV